MKTVPSEALLYLIKKPTVIKPVENALMMHPI